MQLPHARDQGLARVLVGLDLERRILVAQLAERRRHLLLVRLRLRLDRDLDHRLGEVHRLEHDGVVLVAERVAGVDVLQAHRRGDLPAIDLFAVLALVRVHLDDPSQTLPLLLGRVVHVGPRLQGPGVHAKERQLADVRVRHDLEGERRERLVVRRRALLVLQRLGVHALHRRHVDRRGKVRQHRVEELLHAFVLERGAAQDRDDLARQGPLADRALDHLGGRRLSVEVRVQELVVVLRDRLEHVMPRLGRFLLEVARDLTLDVRGALLVRLVRDRLHLDEVDHAGEPVPDVDRDLEGHRDRAQAGLHHAHDEVEVRADAVQLVHERDPRHAVLVRLPPDRLRLRLHAAHAAEHGDGAVEHPEGALHLDGEVDVPRRVDDVDLVVVPETGRRGRRDGDSPLAFLLHPVHGGRAVMDLPHPVDLPRVIEDPLGQGRLTGIDVGHDADVPHMRKIVLPGHSQTFLQPLYQR